MPAFDPQAARKFAAEFHPDRIDHPDPGVEDVPVLDFKEMIVLAWAIACIEGPLRAELALTLRKDT